MDIHQLLHIVVSLFTMGTVFRLGNFQRSTDRRYSPGLWLGSRGDVHIVGFRERNLMQEVKRF